MENELNTTDSGNTAAQGSTTDPAPAEPVEAPKDANAELRAYNQRLKDENAKLRSVAMRAELGQIGLNPDEGLGVAIVETYEGEINAEAIGAFAAEKYKYQPAQAPVPPAVQAEARAETLRAVGEPVTPPPTPDVIQEAEAKLIDPEAGRQDAVSSLTLKSQRLQEQIQLGQT